MKRSTDSPSVADALAFELRSRGLSVRHLDSFGASELSVEDGTATIRVRGEKIMWRVSDIGGAWDIHPDGGALEELADRVAVLICRR